MPQMLSSNKTLAKKYTVYMTVMSTITNFNIHFPLDK